jgi:signal peptide peptidase SppA
VKQTYLPHLAARVFGVPLMVQIDKLMVILDAIGPRIGMREHFAVEGLPVVVTRPAPDDEDEQDDTPMMAGRKPYPVTPDGIAVITVSGTLVKKASWMDAESGLQSYETIRTMLADARDDPGIRGVLLDVDSPGGEVGGLFDLADEVYAVRESKPCYAIANDEAFSAAYALASSAQRLFVTRTGGIGSIGVIAVHMDQSGWDEKMGRKYTAVYAGARKNDFSTHQPLSDDARANLQGEVDRLYEMFVASVARNRGLVPALIRKTDAGLFWGEGAIKAGLADQVGSFDDALAAVTQAAKGFRQSRARASAEAQIEERKDEENTMPQTTETKPADAPAPQGAAHAADPNPTAAAPAPAAQPPAQPAAAAPPAPEPAAAPPAQPAVDAAAIEARIRGEHEEIAALCSLAGEPGFLAEAISKRMTVAQAREALLARKAARSQGTQISSHVDASPVGAEAQLNAAATQIAASKHITFAQAYVEAMKVHPNLYQQYLAEKSATVKPN